MKIKLKEWAILIFLAILCFGFWYKLEYPRFAFIDLSYGKPQALAISEDYLKEKGVDTKAYSRSIVFKTEESFNRFFQHISGFKAEEEFIRKYGFNLFRWEVRFFKESHKEEYALSVSPSSGKVINFSHLIEDVEPRADLGKDGAKQKAEDFLRQNFAVNLDEYGPHEEKVKRYDKRVEYIFSWERKGVHIPWRHDQGVGKLLIEATVSGEEIREFKGNIFDVPEKFERYVKGQDITREILSGIFTAILFLMLFFSMTIVVRERQSVIPRVTKKWFYYIAVFLFVVNTAYFFNNLQDIFNNYPTSAHLGAFVGLAFIRWLFNTGFLIVGFIIPGIAGEVLCSQVFPEKKNISFFSYINSSFFNRGLTKSVLLGYVVWVIALGLQAVVFSCGQKYLGVWREWNTMTILSSAYVPLFGAFVIGVRASFNEEINFRLFGISLAKKHLKSTVLAILLTSVIWGMGHTMYAVYPVWFRILEISLLGIVYGVIFLRFGIVPLIVAHYLFDVFWCSAAYTLGDCGWYLFYTSILLLSLPLLLGIAAYFLNHSREEKPARDILNEVEKYNLAILTTFILNKKAAGCSAEAISRELLSHHWDHLLVNLAVKAVYKD